MTTRATLITDGCAIDQIVLIIAGIFLAGSAFKDRWAKTFQASVGTGLTSIVTDLSVVVGAAIGDAISSIEVVGQPMDTLTRVANSGRAAVATGRIAWPASIVVAVLPFNTRRSTNR